MINAAIVGTGNISSAHIEGLMTFPERCKIAALYDIYPQKAEAVKEKYGLDCPVFSDHKSMLGSGIKFDLIHICTPPYVHAQIAVDCMNTGYNVLVEKPMAASLAECDAMLEAEKRNNVRLACVAQNRFINSIYKLKKTLDSGIAGKLCFAQIESAWWRGHCYYDLWWRGTWEKEGGGPTLNHAVHHIDMLNWLEGRQPDSVIAMLTNVMHDNSEVEDLSVACLHYEDGGMAQITSSVVHHGEEQGIVLQCADAKLSSSWNVKAEISKPTGFPYPGGNAELKKRLDDFYNEIPNLIYEGHTGEIDNVLKALETGGSPLITGIDGRKTVEVITAIYMAAFLGRTIRLPISPKDIGYKFDDILKYAVRFYPKMEYAENLV